MNGQNWKKQMQSAIRGTSAIQQHIDFIKVDNKANASFEGLIPPSYYKRIQDSNFSSALIDQVIPNAKENQERQGYNQDPVDESTKTATPGLLQKYHGRALLTLTSSCAIHCRYCFRRHFNYIDNNPLTGKNWHRALQAIEQDETITEIILSGGDPLMINNSKLQRAITDINKIKHVKHLRIHTRIPTVLPQRIDDELLNMLHHCPLTTIMVIHVNHADEIGSTEKETLHKIKQNVTHLLNQSVLLAKINDSTETLSNLSKTLFDCGVLPYYLHYLDPVAGAGHFHVSKKKARHIYSNLRKQLPGYLLPRLVIEKSNQHSKLPL